MFTWARVFVRSCRFQSLIGTSFYRFLFSKRGSHHNIGSVYLWCQLIYDHSCDRFSLQQTLFPSQIGSVYVRCQLIYDHSVGIPVLVLFINLNDHALCAKSIHPWPRMIFGFLIWFAWKGPRGLSRASFWGNERSAKGPPSWNLILGTRVHPGWDFSKKKSHPTP